MGCGVKEANDDIDTAHLIMRATSGPRGVSAVVPLAARQRVLRPAPRRRRAGA